MSSAGVFSGILSFNNKELSQKSIRSLLFLLFHSYPKIRKLAAEKLYTGVLAMEDTSNVIPNEDDNDKLMEMLSETNWTDELKSLV